MSSVNADIPARPPSVNCRLMQCTKECVAVGRELFWLSAALAAQADNHVDTFDFVPVRRNRCLADMRNIEKVILLLY